MFVPRSAGAEAVAEGCSLLTPKENQKSASDFDALEPRKRGYSPLLTPKILDVGTYGTKYFFHQIIAVFVNYN